MPVYPCLSVVVLEHRAVLRDVYRDLLEAFDFDVAVCSDVAMLQCALERASRPLRAVLEWDGPESIVPILHGLEREIDNGQVRIFLTCEQSPPAYLKGIPGVWAVLKMPFEWEDFTRYLLDS